MRLINVDTLVMEEYFNENIPPYAVLSHTWGQDNEELTLQDMVNRVDKYGVGSFKIRHCCDQAKADGLQYAWVDTCCIDKTNAVELSEAINSMFRWYSRSAVCYAYLSDVPDGEEPSKPESKFRSSRWFERGWTLQELLAPKVVRFYSMGWQNMGTKGENSAIIDKITGVPQHYLLGLTELREASVAQRMSWAARRMTKREEDLTYCLLGIFDVTMPMVYGEGSVQAFFRLQEEIMKRVQDDSILAWGWGLMESPCLATGKLNPGKVLATGPSDFAGCTNIICRELSSTHPTSVEMSSGRLRLKLPLLTNPAGETLGLLNSGPEDDPQQAILIPLAKSSKTWSDEYVRPKGRLWSLQPIPVVERPSIEVIYVRYQGKDRQTARSSRHYWLYRPDHGTEGLDLVEVYPLDCWDNEKSLIMSRITGDGDDMQPTLARFRQGVDGADFLIALEVVQEKSGLKGHCHVMTCGRDTDLQGIANNWEHIRLDAARKHTATNGLLNLEVGWEPVARQPIFVLDIKPSKDAPMETLDATKQLEQVSFGVETANSLESFVNTNKTREKLEAKIDQAKRCRKVLIEERSKTEAEIASLQHKLKSLQEMEHESNQELLRLQTQEEEMNQNQKNIMEHFQLLHRRWNEEWGAWRSRHGAKHYWKLVDALLLLAAERGDEALVRQILQEFPKETQATGNWDWGSQNETRSTPLHLAVEHRHESIVRLFLSAGADPWPMNEHTYQPLHLAAKKGYEEMVSILLQCGNVDARVYWNGTSLHIATLEGHDKIVALLLEEGADPNARDDDDELPTALHVAARKGYDTIVTHLLAKGADIHSPGELGQPLHYAIEAGHEAIVKQLVAHGADINSSAPIGHSPLHLAVLAGSEPIVRHLLTHGASREAITSEKETALHLAALGGHEGIVSALLEHGADLTASCKKMWKPLDYAVSKGHEAIVRKLIDAGGDANHRGWNLQRPMNQAMRRGQWSIMMMLRERYESFAD